MRLFVAIELAAPVREAQVKLQSRQRRDWPMVRWTGPDQLHVTVKFLGDVLDRRVPEVCSAVERAAAAVAPFSARFDGTGCFPPRGPVRIIWVGADDSSGAFRRCAEAVEFEFEAIGFPREDRPFTPHVTVGRVKEDATAGRLREAMSLERVDPRTQPIAALTLMSSVLSPKGSTYAVVSRAALRGAGNVPS